MPSTPYLRVDVGRLHANIAATASWAAAAGVSLRPHAKTHKSPEIARPAARGRCRRAERRDGRRGRGLRRARRRGPLRRLSAVAVRGRRTASPGPGRASRPGHRGRLGRGPPGGPGALLAGTGVAVLVEVDSGQHRTRRRARRRGSGCRSGCRGGPRRTRRLHLPRSQLLPRPDGVGRRRRGGRSGRSSRVLPRGRSRARHRQRRLDPDARPRHTADLTELRPGVYVFGDAQQWELGVMPPESIALTCRATVVSHAGGRLVLDSGSKVLGADRAAYATGSGPSPGPPGGTDRAALRAPRRRRSRRGTAAAARCVRRRRAQPRLRGRQPRGHAVGRRRRGSRPVAGGRTRPQRLRPLRSAHAFPLPGRPGRTHRRRRPRTRPGAAAPTATASPPRTRRPPPPPRRRLPPRRTRLGPAPTPWTGATPRRRSTRRPATPTRTGQVAVTIDTSFGASARPSMPMRLRAR